MLDKVFLVVSGRKYVLWEINFWKHKNLCLNLRGAVVEFLIKLRKFQYYISSIFIQPM